MKLLRARSQSGAGIVDAMSALVAVLVCAIGFTACGESACGQMMDTVCDDCAGYLSPEWEAACQCWSNSSYVKVNGFHCQDPDDYEQDSCRITLDVWQGDKSCAALNRHLPGQDRLDDLSK